MADPVTIGTAVGWGISVAGWLISPIISKLLSKGYSYLGSRSPDNLKELERKVLQLKVMLEAAEASPQRGNLEQWTTKLKSACYEAEDIVDAIDYHRIKSHVLHQTTTQGAEIDVPRLLRTKLGGTLNEIENLINEGQGLISLLRLPATCYNINNTPSKTVRPPIRTTSTPPDVFGRDGDLEMIRKLLRDTPADGEPSSRRTKCYSVIGIHGIPGSGKTTLAQYVCEHEKEDGYFNLIMWIHVSQNFSVDTILAEMLAKATKREKVEFSSLDMLESELKENLKGKRFFLVLDDIWHDKGVSDQQLDRLLSPLMVGEMGSKILVTTRFADAARALGAQNLVPMPEMDKDQYLSMFMHYALDGARIIDQALLREHNLIGRKIAEKLGGSPLAARTVAGQLKIRQDIDFWRRSLNRDLLSDTVGAIWWSYQQLDEHVRQCFTYCSMFPRRYELQRDELVHLWVAEGFVDMEDIGHDCFDVLLSCSFIQPKGKGPYFTIHDLMHDLAERVAGNDCFRFEKGMEDRIPRDVRHLFMESYDESVFREQVLKLKTLRAIFVVPGWVQEMTKKDWEELFKNLKKLRVVHLPAQDDYEIPENIGELEHLRYLCFSGSCFQMILPRTFSKLYHLHKFSAPDCLVDFSPVKEMSNLVNLQYINTENRVCFPDIGRLTWLRTLPIFTVMERRGHEIQQLEHLDSLRGTLEIWGLQNVDSKDEAHQAKLANKLHVSHLVLGWTEAVTPFEMMLTKSQRNHDGRKSKKFRRLLEAEGTNREHRTPDPQEGVLEALCPPFLVKSLKINAYSGSTYPSWLSGEQCKLENLQHLSFHGCDRLDAPPMISEFLVHLRTLVIYNCSWHSLPENMERLTSLKELDISLCKNILSLPRLPLSLKRLGLFMWKGSVVPPEITGFLVNLHVYDCIWHSLPENMEHLTSLKELNISMCKNILSLPRLPLSLKRLNLTNCNRSLTERCLADPNLKKIVRIS